LRLRDLKNIDKTYLLTIDEIISFYKKWVSQDEYLKLLDGRDLYLNSEVRHITYFKASKRGNDVYVWRTRKRTELLDIAFMNYEPQKIGRKYIASNIIWFVLTFKRTDLRKDYQNARNYINYFMKKLRRINVGTRKKPSYPFRKAKVIERTYEAQSSGYIHINLIVFLGDNITIIGKRYKTEDGKIRYIIENEIIRDLFKECWIYGFADVAVLAKINDKNYFTKYITKSIRYDEKNNKHILTLSLSWFFRKRSFFINYKILEFLFNINLRLDKEGGINKSLMCCDAIFYKKIGIVLAKEMGFNPKRWFYYKKEKINIKLLSYYSY
jgi:hypothetical protein